MSIAVLVVAGVVTVGFYIWNARRRQEAEQQRLLEQRLTQVSRVG